MPPTFTASSFLKSEWAHDSNGNPGDNYDLTFLETAYASPLTRGVDLVELAPLWCARAGLLVFDECPPAAYQPRLAPERRLLLDELDVDSTSGTLSQVLAAVPLGNVERVAFNLRAHDANAGEVSYGFGYPTAHQALDVAADVFTMAPEALTSGLSGAIGLNVEDMLGAFLQVLVGSSDEGDKILRGAELVLRRRFIGG